MRVESKQSGFTLIETIIYIALLGFIIGGGLIAVFNILEGSGRTREAMYREQEAYFIGRKIDAILSEATSISEPGPGGTSDTLTVNAPGGSVTVSLINEKIVLERGGEEYPLNSALSLASGLSFESHIASSTMTSQFSLDGEAYSVSNYLP